MTSAGSPAVIEVPDLRHPPVAEAERLFTALSVQGQVEMPPQNMFWGDYFGSFTDQFGIRWMINVPNKA